MSKIKRIISLILAAILFFVIICEVISFVSIKSGAAKNKDFYSQEENFDVLFLGSSHALMGVLPMELWNDYGMISYNLGNYGQWLPVDYWILKNALRQTMPKLVVVEAYGVMLDEKYSENHLGFLHEMFDEMPNSVDKKNAIEDLFPTDIQKEFFWPFYSHHSRWEVCDESFFRSVSSTYQKGADENGILGVPSDQFVTSCEPIKKIPLDRSNHTQTTGKEYLEKIISLCENNGIDVLLSVTPFIATEEQQEWLNSVSDIAGQYDVNYLNGVREGVIDTHTDLWDKYHLNSSGARKWTDYLGNYIRQNYDVEDHREDPKFSNWHNDYQNYVAYDLEQLKEQKDLYNFLMLLKNPQYDVCLFITESSEIYKDEKAMRLIENIGFEEICEAGENQATFLSTTGKDVIIDVEELLRLPEGCNADIQIMVWDVQSGELVEHAYFTTINQNVYSRY